MQVMALYKQEVELVEMIDTNFELEWKYLLD
jgi:hypothetical protein